MSHFTRVRTQLKNMETVQQALEDLGYTVEEGTVRGYHGQRAKADLIVKTDSSYDIGFRMEGENVVVVGDFWGLRINREEFIQQVSQRYAYITVTQTATAGGWSKLAEEVQEDGSIRLVMQRWS